MFTKRLIRGIFSTAICAAALITAALPATAAVDIPADTASAASEADIAESARTSDANGKPFPRWTVYTVLTFLFLSIAAIPINRYLKKRNERRFLTTMRLSVLDRSVQQACRYIENRFSNPELSIDDVCRELVTGEAYLNTLFVKELGIDVRDFITQVRINGIKFFLAENPERDAATICSQCGFAKREEAETQFTRLCGVGIDEYAAALRGRRD